MADRTITERLQPSLLDRLTDAAPESTSERREERVIDVRRLREIVRRDLAWLLNTTNQEGEIDTVRYPNVAVSTVNYGIREVTGGISGARRAQQIQAAIRQSIARFEPRIAPDTIQVELREAETQGEMVINFDIRADMWAQPLPLELYMRSEVNLVTGELTLDRSTG